MHCIAFSPDNSKIVYGRNCFIIIADAITGKRLNEISLFQARFFSVDFSPDCLKIISSSSRNIMVWDVITGKEILKITDCDYVESVKFLSDGKKIVSLGSYYIKIWNATTGKLIETLCSQRRIKSIMFSYDNLEIVCFCDNGDIDIWDIETYQMIKTIESENRRAAYIALCDPVSNVLNKKLMACLDNLDSSD